MQEGVYILKYVHCVSVCEIVIYGVFVLSLESLKDTLLSYMERKDMDIPPDVEELFPAEILLSHYVETWKFSVAFKQERHRQ